MPRFLLAQLHFDSIETKTTLLKVEKALESLPTGPEAYGYLYQNAMERINSQAIDFKELARQVLSWIICAERQLKTFELRHALAVEVGETKINEHNLPEIEDMVSACAGLVTIDEESNIIRLVHYTTQEYFEHTKNHWFPNAEVEITTICISYLSFSVFEIGPCQTNNEFDARLESNPLYDYAARYWGDHARRASIQIQKLILDFLNSGAKISSSSQVIMTSRVYAQYRPSGIRQTTAVHVAAYFGLKEEIIALINTGFHTDSKDVYGRTPLSWAAENGHEAVVELLLGTNGVDPDPKDEKSRTPLWWAVSGNEATVQALLANDRVDPNLGDEEGGTPLIQAIWSKSEAIVKLLLANDRIDPNLGDEEGDTPLMWAIWSKSEAIVKLLLANDRIDLSLEDEENAILLLQAI
jgi:hypothetical protein